MGWLQQYFVDDSYLSRIFPFRRHWHWRGWCTAMRERRSPTRNCRVIVRIVVRFHLWRHLWRHVWRCHRITFFRLNVGEGTFCRSTFCRGRRRCCRVWTCLCTVHCKRFAFEGRGVFWKSWIVGRFPGRGWKDILSSGRFNCWGGTGTALVIFGDD